MKGNDHKQALEYYNKSLAIYLQVYGENHAEVARVQKNIARSTEKLNHS
jgi:hypothetical protein